MRFEISEVITQDQVMDLVYGNNGRPKRLLGRHYVKDGQVIAAYHPDAVRIEVIRDDGESFPMDPIERQPVYALYFPGREPFHYQLKMTFRDGNTFTSDDPYSSACQITDQEEEAFLKGTWTDAHRKLGCHPVTINNVEGCYFALWAPSARRVSLVGDFNFWNGMIYPMNRLERSGIFEIFIPGLASGHRYKFEVKNSQGDVLQIPDPFGTVMEDGPGDASKILNMNEFAWSDASWMQSRRYRQRSGLLESVCEVYDGEGVDFHDLYDGNFTHLLFSHYISKDQRRDFDETLIPYNTGLCHSFYCGGSPDALRKVIDEAHREGVSILMEISPGFFFRTSVQMMEAVGAPLFSYSDSRIGYRPDRDMWMLCFRNPEIRSLVLSSLLFWIREYHIDGFVFEGIREMLSPPVDTFNNLDTYLAQELAGIPEENVHFLEQAVEAIHREDISVILIAEEEPDFISASPRFLSLYRSFDYFWDYSVRKNMSIYLEKEFDERWKEHYRLTLPIQSRELGRSLIVINSARRKLRDAASIDNSAGAAYDIMSAEMRMTEAFLIGVPGRKVWSWTGIRDRDKAFIYNLFRIYRKYPALYESGTGDISFEWVNCVDAPSSVVSFLRRSSKKNSMLLFVSNFSDRAYENRQLGVAAYGRYRMILSSDAEGYGGSGSCDGQDVISMRQQCDFRPYSIRVSLPAQTTLIFEYLPLE